MTTTARIFDVKHFAVHDGDGIRTTVFFKGCPLRCVWCHNPEGIGSAPQLAYDETKCVACGACAAICPAGAHSVANGIHTLTRSACVACGKCAAVCPKSALTLYGKETTVDELLPHLLEDRDFYEGSGGGVTLSGGECLLQADFCAELLQALKAHGIHTAVDTCGFVSKQALDKVIPFTDVVLYDLKAYDEEVHLRCTGRPNGQILENLKYLDALGKEIEIRIPYVPDFNDGQIEQIAGFLSDFRHVRRIRVLAYHNYAGSKYAALSMTNTLPSRLPTEEELSSSRALIRRITGKDVPD